jgi:hypothetical protein
MNGFTSSASRKKYSVEAIEIRDTEKFEGEKLIFRRIIPGRVLSTHKRKFCNIAKDFFFVKYYVYKKSELAKIILE